LSKTVNLLTTPVVLGDKACACYLYIVLFHCCWGCGRGCTMSRFSALSDMLSGSSSDILSDDMPTTTST